MNKTAIKNFSVWAREKLISDIIYKASMIGITEDGIADELPQSTNDLHFFDIGTKNYAEVSGKEIEQRDALVSAIKKKERDIQNYKEAFRYLIEEVAYTWFNRLIAIRFMEVNDYLPSGVRVLSSENKAKKEPDLVTAPFDTDLEFTSSEQDKIIQLKDDNELDELFRILFIKQCNKLHDILPDLFEKTDDYSELLLTIPFTDPDGIIYHLVNDIEEVDFRINDEMYTDDGKIKADGQVEIIGWLYQYYNIEPKAAVFGRASGKKISKEEIPAATQLFTPDWIVRYMVENSLGRIWIEGHPDNSLKDTWKYYIDEAEQEPDVVAKLEEIKSTYKELAPESIKIIDPCMGTDDWKTATELSFEPDADNCIPITDEEYFEDDIVGLFCAWLKKVYGEDTLEENLDFIANALGNKGKTSREVIRNYFLTDFIKDHIKTYQKRPIYWLFDSGKQNGFKALVYMHRWNADTIGNVRVEYLHRIQRVYEKEIVRMQEIIDNSHDNKEISNATKRKEKLQKQIKETKDYDAKIAHLALSRIDIRCYLKNQLNTKLY